MTAPSSSPRGEHTPRPGAAWEQQLVAGVEVVVEDDRGESPFGWSEPPRANRATRRAAKRARGRKA